MRTRIGGVPDSTLSPEPLAQGNLGPLSQVVSWLERNSIFKRTRPLPPIGFDYRYHEAHIGGAAAFNTAGVFVTQALTPQAGWLVFDEECVVVRVEMTISVRANGNNAVIGAAIVKNMGAAATNLALTGMANMVLVNLTNNSEAVISKHFAWSPYSGLRMQPSTNFGIAVIGDAAGICGVTVNYHWTTSPGNVIEK